jgi:hypothetical protein
MINMKKKVILSLLFIIVISLSTIVVVFLVQSKKDIKPIVNLTNKQLPAKNLPVELIKNSVIDNLFANTEGYVSEKYDKHFILSNGNNTIKLYVEEDMNITNFYRGDSSKSNHILFSDIKVGDHLSGGVSIVPNKFGAEEFINRYNPGDIIAHTMIVLP